MKHDPDFMEKINKSLEAYKAAYRILDVSESADKNELKKAYRKAATKYHPDHNGNTPEANKRFVLIKCAYELLAFDRPCEKILEEINSWPGVPENGKYRLENPWGHFLWWRESFLNLKKRKEHPMKTTVLLVFNRNPYDGTDITWNALRLADQLLNLGIEVNIFLMNDSVDLARDAAKPPEGYFDLGKMLKDLISKNVSVKVCGTCKVRCGIHKGEPYFEGAQEAKMTELAQWVKEADRVISF